MRRGRADRALVITSAPQNPDAEFEHRRRRYALMMGLRAFCVIAAACTYQISFWFVVIFIGGGAVLPWCAVILANDRPPLSKDHRAEYSRPVPSEPMLGPGDDGRTVDG
jgi:hypothetical protein